MTKLKASKLKKVFVRVSLELLLFFAILYSYVSLYFPNILSQNGMHDFIFIVFSVVLVWLVFKYNNEINSKYALEEGDGFGEKIFLFMIFLFSIFVGALLYISFYEEKGLFWFGFRYGMFLLYLFSYVIGHYYIDIILKKGTLPERSPRKLK